MREPAYERSLRAWMRVRGMTWSRDRYSRTSGGGAVAYRLSPPSPPRAVVLPIHGAGNDALFGLPGLIKRLLLAGYEVFAFDVDGHGRASTTIFDPEMVGGAVPQAIRESGAVERGLPLHGIGISLGGALLLHTMGAAPRAFASGALLAAPLDIRLSRRAVLAEMGWRTLRALWREREHCGLWGAVPAFGRLKRDLYPLRLAKDSGAGSFSYIRVLNDALAELALSEAAQRVRTPTLLAYGTGDLVAPISQGEDLHRLISGSEMVRLDGETHLTTPLTPRVTERLLDWIDGHTERGGDPARSRA